MREKAASVAILSLVLSAAAIGQQRGAIAAAPAFRGSVGVAPFVAARPAVSRTVAAGYGTVRRAGSASRPVVRGRVTHPVVGKSSGYTHLTAQAPNAGNANYNAAADGYGVPGLGFDYPHYFATHPNARNHVGNFTGFIFPFVGGGIYLPVPLDEEGDAGVAGEQ